MSSPSKASIVGELLLSHGAESAGLSASAPCATSGHVCGIKLGKAVLLSDVGSLTASKPFVTPGTCRDGVSGVSISPDGSCIAAFSSDELYVAEVHAAGSVGHLQHVAQLAGIKAVYWCPGSTALAVCCKQQADIKLLVLHSKPQEREKVAATSAAPQPAFALAPLQQLPGPRSAPTGARCAAWLPHSEPGGPAALLAAWPSDLLMYTWPPAQQGVDWAHHKVHRFLAGWPGPVRSLAVAACPGRSDSSLILGTVDAQLSLRLNSHNSINSRSLGRQPVSAAGGQQARQPSAADDATGHSSTSGSPLQGAGSVLRGKPNLAVPSGSGVAIDTGMLKQPAAIAAGTSRLSSLLHSPGVLRASHGLITPLQPEEAAAPTSSDMQSSMAAAAAQSDAGAEVESKSGCAAAAAAAVHPSPYPDVDDLLAPRSLAQPVELTGLGSGRLGGVSGGSSVLNSLMNITAQPAAGSAMKDDVALDTSSSSDGSACLCMLQVRLSDFYNSTTSSSSSPSSASSQGSSANHQHSTPQHSSTGSPPLSKGVKSSRRRLYNSTVQLPHLLTPILLTVHQYMAAVGSSTGQPRVTLCSFAAPKQGLQILQTVTVPLPSPYAQDALVKARLEGLLLTPATQQQQQQQPGLAASSSIDAGTRYPRIADGCLTGPADEDVIWHDSNSSSSSNEQQLLPAIVVLLRCTEVQQHGNFANIGSTAANRTADVFLVKCTMSHHTTHQAVQQYSRQALFSQQLPHQQTVHAAEDMVPLRIKVSASGYTAAAVSQAGTEDCVWWRSAVQQAEKDKQQQQQGDIPSQRQMSSAVQTLQKLKQQEQKQLEHFTRHRELKHPSVVPGVGRSVSVETVGSYVSNGTTWTSLTEDFIHPQHQHLLQGHDQNDHHPQQQQPVQQQLQVHEDEVQAAVTRGSKVVAVLSRGQAWRGHQLPASQQPDAVSGAAAPACAGSNDHESLVRPGDSVVHRTGSCSAPGYSSSAAAESVALSRVQSRVAEKRVHHEELHSELTFSPVPGLSSLRPSRSPDRPAVLSADQPGSIATHKCADRVQRLVSATHGSAAELYDLQRQVLQLQGRQHASDEAASASRTAISGLQASLEQRLDALLQLQQRQQQQQEEMQRQQQKLLLAQAERESALASVLASFHTSMETRLDAMQELMRDMVKQLDRLASGIEEIEGS